MAARPGFLGDRSDPAARVAGNLAHVAYKVHTDVFEGPFDLLLQLITEQQVDLYEVGLADIVDAFLRRGRGDRGSTSKSPPSSCSSPRPSSS